MSQLQENFWKIGWTDRWSDRLPAKVRDPIKIYYRATTAKSYQTLVATLLLIITQ